MKTLAEMHRAGYSVWSRLPMEHGGPYNNERSVDATSLGAPASRYLRQDDVELSARGDKTLTDSAIDEARRVAERGETVLLVAEDFSEPPAIHTFIEKEGAEKVGGPGYYRYVEKVYQTLSSQSLTDFCREIVHDNKATWAIRPQMHPAPEDPYPELYILVPEAVTREQTSAVNATDVHQLLFGKLGESPRDQSPPDDGIHVDGNSVTIAGVRLTRSDLATAIRETSGA